MALDGPEFEQRWSMATEAERAQFAQQASYIPTDYIQTLIEDMGHDDQFAGMTAEEQVAYLKNVQDQMNQIGHDNMAIGATLEAATDPFRDKMPLRAIEELDIMMIALIHGSLNDNDNDAAQDQTTDKAEHDTLVMDPYKDKDYAQRVQIARDEIQAASMGGITGPDLDLLIETKAVDASVGLDDLNRAIDELTQDPTPQIEIAKYEPEPALVSSGLNMNMSGIG